MANSWASAACAGGAHRADEQNDLGSSPQHEQLRENYERKLREIVDPEAANAQAFAAQARLVEHYGGRDGIQRYRSFNYTPLPDSLA